MPAIAKSPIDLEWCARCGFHRSVHDGKSYTLGQPKLLSQGVVVMPCEKFEEKVLQKPDEVLGEHLSTDHETRFVCTRDSITVFVNGFEVAKFKRVFA